jgi:acyl-CoA reductase-like NAD-dependent aldehyde dehydrogenase
MKLDVLNKYSGEIIDSLESDTAETIKRKIKRTSQWEYRLLNTTLDERINIIKDIADVLIKDKKRIKDLIVAEGGLPIKYSEWEFSMIEKGYSYVDWFKDLVQDRNQTDLESGNPSLVRYQPMGLTIGISPRNTPMSLPMYFWGSAFLTGNPAIII